MGARWLRFDVKWSVIQPSGPQSFVWSRYDSLVDAANSRGLKVLGTLAYAPTWAQSSECAGSFMCKPRDAEEYGRWAAASVAHFRGRVSNWEIWNEPNISGFFQPRPDVALYTAMVRAAYPKIKAADPQAFVLAGATAPAANDAQRIDEVSFLQGVYANGGRGFFDAWSHHPYTHPNPPGNVHQDSAWYQMYGSSPNMRSVMTAQGDGAKQIWATEYGPPTSGTPGAVSEAMQAQTVADAYRLWRGYTWAGPLFWYCDRDLDPLGASTESWRYFGLLRYDLSRKPAWDAYRVSASAP
jgi:polysaccharide biosynthesis protein PslG